MRLLAPDPPRSPDAPPPFAFCARTTNTNKTEATIARTIRTVIFFTFSVRQFEPRRSPFFGKLPNQLFQYLYGLVFLALPATGSPPGVSETILSVSDRFFFGQVGAIGRADILRNGRLFFDKPIDDLDLFLLSVDFRG